MIYSDIFENAPTIKTFEDDYKVFRQIAVKYPGLIEEAANLIEEKYSELSGFWHLSEDYSDWHFWLRDIDEEINFLAKEPKKGGINGSIQQAAIRYTDIVLKAIPPDKPLRNGRSKLLGMRWFIRSVSQRWHFRSEGNIDPILFYAFISQVLNSAMDMIKEEHRPKVARVVKCNDKTIREIGCEVLYGRTQTKRWEGRPLAVSYFGSTNGLSLKEQFSHNFSKFHYILFHQIGRNFYQKGYFLAHLRRSRLIPKIRSKIKVLRRKLWGIFTS